MGASKFLSMKGLLESPSPIVAIGTVTIGLALLFAIVSNDTTRVIVLSQ